MLHYTKKVYIAITLILIFTFILLSLFILNRSVRGLIINNNFADILQLHQITSLSNDDGRMHLQKDSDWNINDNFNDPSLNISDSKWKFSATQYEFSNNELQFNSSTYDNSIAYIESSDIYDGFTESDIMVNNGEQMGGVVFRYQNSQNYYKAFYSALYQNVAVERVVNGNTISLGSTSFTGTSSSTYYTFRVEYSNFRFKVFIDSLEVLSVEDTNQTFTNGQVGVWRTGTSANFDNFEAKEVGYWWGYSSSEIPTQLYTQHASWTTNEADESFSYPTNDYNFSKSYYNSKNFTNGEVSADIKVLGGEQIAGIAFGVQDDLNYYAAEFSELYNSVSILKYTNGVAELIGSEAFPDGSYPLNNFHTLKVIRDGAFIEVQINDISYATANDSTYPSGYIGFYRHGSAANFKNLQVISKYHKTGSFVSDSFNQANNINSVIVNLVEYVPLNTDLILYVSNDNGNNWDAIANGQSHTFDEPGNNFKYKVVLTTSDNSVSPYLESISFDISTGDWQTSSKVNLEDSVQFGNSIGNSNTVAGNYDPSKLEYKGVISNDDVVVSAGISISENPGELVQYYISSTDFSLVAYDLNNYIELWRTPLGSGSNYAESVPAYNNGVIYAASYSGLYAVDSQTGNILWSYNTSSELLGGVKISDGLVYVSSFGSGTSGKVIAVNLSTESLEWIYNLPNGENLGATPAIDQESQSVFVSSISGNLYAINISDGQLKWQNTEGFGSSWGGVSISEEKVFHISQGKGIRAIDKFEGNVIWSNDENFGGFTGVGASAIFKNIIVYGASNNYIYARNIDDGSFLWSHQYSFTTNTGSNPEISEDGYVYHLVDNGLHVFDIDNGNLLFNSAQNGWDGETGVSLGGGSVIFNERIDANNYELHLYQISSMTYNSTDSININFGRQIKSIKINNAISNNIDVNQNGVLNILEPNVNVLIEFGDNPNVVSKPNSMIIIEVNYLNLVVSNVSGPASFVYNVSGLDVSTIYRDGVIFENWSIDTEQLTINDTFSTHEYSFSTSSPLLSGNHIILRDSQAVSTETDIEVWTDTIVDIIPNTIIVLNYQGTEFIGGDLLTNTDITLTCDPDGIDPLAGTTLSSAFLVDADNGYIEINSGSDSCSDWLVIDIHGDGGNSLTNPGTSGNYGWSTIVDLPGTGGIDYSGATLAYVADDNDVLITAVVPPVLDMELYQTGLDAELADPNTCALGVLSLNTVNTCTYDIGTGTNSSSGVSVYMSADNTLDDGLGNDIDNTVGTVDAGSEEYGFYISELGGGEYTAAGSYNVAHQSVPLVNTLIATTSTVGNGTTIGQSAQRMEIEHAASMSTDTIVGSYNQLVTYTAYTN